MFFDTSNEESMLMLILVLSIIKFERVAHCMRIPNNKTKCQLYLVITPKRSMT